MQLYPKTIERKLSFDKIRALLETLCKSQLGKNQVSTISVLDNSDQIELMLASTREIKQQIESGDTFPELLAFELHQELKKSQVQGYYLSAENLFRLKHNVQLASQLTGYFKKRPVDYPIWSAKSKELSISKKLVSKLDEVFDRNGAIKDSASSRLKKIRQEIQSKQVKSPEGAELNSKAGN